MTATDPVLQDLIDTEAIRRCITRAARGNDRHDDNLLRESFWPDATDDHGTVIGLASDFFHKAGTRIPNWRAHQHFIMNQFIDTDGDTAHVETYFMAMLLRLHDDGSDFSVGRYCDRLERRGGEWRIAHRLTILEFAGTIPVAGGDASAMPTMDAFVKGTWDRSDPSYRRPLVLDREPRG